MCTPALVAPQAVEDMPELQDLLDDALNSISNSEAAKAAPPKPLKSSEEQIQGLLDNLDDSFSDDMLKNLADVNIAETNELIESVLGELISKDILYEPFQSMKNKIEEEIKSGNRKNEKGLELIGEILHIFDDQGKSAEKSKNSERLMQLIYELQEQGDLWQVLSEDS